MRFVLASASPARLSTLRHAGVRPEVIVSGVDESGVRATSTAELVLELATLKARAVRDRITGDALVLGCDSLLEFDGASMGKPGGADEAAARWRRMRGRSGVLHTGHCLTDGARTSTATVPTTVEFADVTDEEIELYCHSGEPAQVAGGFTIDGLGGWFVDAVAGDPHNVVGLSLPTLRRMLAGFGVGLHDLGYPTSS